MAEARTLIYIHGIGNKPPPEVLKREWDQALIGFDLGERSRMAYWVNRVRHPEPERVKGGEGDRTRALGLAPPPAGRLPPELSALARRLAAQPRSRKQGKLLPLPEPLRGLLTRWLTRAFLDDVADYFYDATRRAAMRQSLAERLVPGGGPYAVIAHSLGSLIAYDVLSGLTDAGVQVPLFVSLGSPLGLTEVKDRLKKLVGRPLATPECVGRWINLADRLDPVALDKRLEGEYRASKRGVAVEDIPGQDNPERPDAHAATGYLRSRELNLALTSAIDLAAFQPVAPFVLARELSRRLEQGAATDRHELLLGVQEVRAGSGETLDSLRARVLGAIRNAAPEADEQCDLQLDVLKRYVSVRMTRAETERLAALLEAEGAARAVHHVWPNARKVALLEKSLQTIQAAPAHAAHNALGEGITWAVLDSGVNGAHPHFAGGVVARQFDATARGAISELPAAGNSDGNGHGTHVCGIVAGAVAGLRRKDGSVVSLSGVAPRAKLHVYRVLAADGSGSDAGIIKAIEHLSDLNEAAGRRVVQGVNLSLGGPFDQSSFGCGHSPLCVELRRLWHQGVVVVLAAGNEGFVRLLANNGEIDANMDLSIGDPANLEEAIAVGSVHKENPQLYGLSYFSSRGPTADGRGKPDVVAPGERVLSCRHVFRANAASAEELYLEMSGTSMAAPHVSGLIAAFLSVRREYLGFPEKIKALLREHCTDLGRDRYHQGAGLPNLMKMLSGS